MGKPEKSIMEYEARAVILEASSRYRPDEDYARQQGLSIFEVTEDGTPVEEDEKNFDPTDDAALGAYIAAVNERIKNSNDLSS